MNSPIFMIDVSFRDRDGNAAQMRFSSLRGLSFDAAEARAYRLVSALQGVSDAVITGFTVYKVYTLPPTLAAGPESDVTRKAVFVVSLENNYYGVFVIPSLKRDTMLDDGNGNLSWVIDWTRPEWAELNLALQGLLSQTGLPITGLVIGGEAH